MVKGSSKKQAMIRGGKLLASIKKELVDFAQTAETLEEIDNKANSLIDKSGGKPSFKMVPGYDWSTCINLNSGVVHGIPKGRLETGDLVTIDVGLYYQGYHTDTATSFVVGDSSKEKDKFLEVGRKILASAIGQAKSGKKVKNISRVIEEGIVESGYNVIRELTGHGVGEQLHQQPAIPCFVSKMPDMEVTLRSGMAVAIEVMYVMGDWPLKKNEDGWTLETRDGLLGAVFEETVYLDNDRTLVLTAI
jgi:methionyl aminopeptidase